MFDSIRQHPGPYGGRNRRHAAALRSGVRRGAVLTAWLLAALLLGVAVEPLQAGTGTVVQLPSVRKKVRNGLTLQIDTRWVDGTGYRPLRLRLSPATPGPAAADRRLTVTIRPRGWHWPSSRFVATGTVELLQGDLFGESVIAVPQDDGWSMVDVEVHEDGHRLDDLCERYNSNRVRYYHEWSEAIPSILIVASEAPPLDVTNTMRQPPPPRGEASRLPDIRALVACIPHDRLPSAFNVAGFDASVPSDVATILRLADELPWMEIVPPDALPARWIELTCLDVICISLDDARRLAGEQPARWQAIRDWLATGTLLCVYDLGRDYQRLAELERLLELPAPREAEARPAEGELRGWQLPDPRLRRDQITALQRNNLRPANGSAPVALRRSGKPGGITQSATLPPAPRPFVVRDFGQGHVAAWAAADPFADGPQNWVWLFNSLGADWAWYYRHGFSMHRKNPEYWNLLIPGVGQAPVTSFLVLISLFVVAIGPVNYFVLRRSGRLYLLLITVPAGAALVALSLFVYALLTDGLAVRARTRSYTEIDQRDGRVVAFSRQSYYAGLLPSGGLTFPADAAVYPVDFHPRPRYMAGVERRLVWGQRQRLASGYLTTRTTKQLFVVESRRTTAGLEIDERGSTPRVTNRLGSDVQRLVLRASDGKYYAAEQLPAGRQTRLAPVRPQQVSQVWNRLLADSLPVFPDDFDPFHLENAANILPDFYRYHSSVDSGLPLPSFRHGLMETGMRGAVGGKFAGLAPRSYVALVDRSPEVSLGVDSPRQEAGFHLLKGRW